MRNAHLLTALALGAALLAGTGLTLHGIVTIAWSQLPWLQPGELGRFLSYLLAFTAATGVLAAWRKLDPISAGGIVLAGLCFLAGEWLALLFLPLFALSAATLGASVASRLGRPSVDPLLDLLLGAGLLGTLIGLLAHFPLARPPLYAALLLAPILLARARAAEVVATVAAGLHGFNPARGGTSGGLALLFAVALGLLHAAVAFLPELGHDALAMHLYLPTFMERQLQWNFDPSLYAWALMPMLGDWLYALLYILAGESATRLLNVGFVLLLAALVHRLARWMGVGPKPALWAVLLYLSMPLTFTESSSLFIDAFWTACLLAAALHWLEADGQEVRATAVLAGSFTGLAFAAKLGSLTFLPLLALCAGWALAQQRALRSPALLAHFALPLLLLGGIPYLTAWLISGNPVFPFFNAIFQSPYYPANDFQSGYPGYLGWDLLYQAVFNSARFMEGTAGVPGFQWLVLLPAGALAALLWGKRRAWLLLAAALATVVLTFAAQSYLRYVFAALLLLSCVLVLPLQAEARGLRRLAQGTAALCVLANLLFLPAATWTYRELPLGIVFDERAREAYLERVAPLRTLIPLVNALNLGDRPVVFLAESPGVAGMRSDVLFTNWYNQRLLSGLSEMISRRDPEGLAALLWAEGAELIVLDETQRGAEFNAALYGIAEPLARRGQWTLLRLREEFQISAEKLSNAELEGPEGWQLVGEAFYSEAADALVVSESSPAWQSVPVKPQREFRLRQQSACHEAVVQGRLQVNWYDEDGDYLDSRIELFTCTTQAAWHELVVQSPHGAVEAIVFLSSHEAAPFRVHAVSFR